MTNNSMIAEEDMCKSNILQIAIRRRVLIDTVKVILTDIISKGESIEPNRLYETIIKMEKKV